MNKDKKLTENHIHIKDWPEGDRPREMLLQKCPESLSDVNIIPQFKIGEYIRAEYARQIPRYRVDFLMTFSKGGKEQTLILEYDGVEYHTKNPDIVTKHNFSQEYLDYDISRQIELESYGYRFLRLNKFNLRPGQKDETKGEVLDSFLRKAFVADE